MKKIFKENYKFIISIILIVLTLTTNFPYYIDAPGGITDMREKIEIEGYDSKGSFNLAFVKEYKATIPTLLISLFNKDWNVIKNEDVLLDNETDETYFLRDKILMEESISNAIYVAYKYADKKINILNTKIYVTYISDIANTNLIVGDQIISINEKEITSKEDLMNIINSLNINDKLNIKVINNDKYYNRYAYIIDDNESKKIGILPSIIREYKTNPDINIKVDKNESGASGGLITALSIYDSLNSKDITNGLTIVGTGTIDENGNIGSIGGVEYKLKSAVKSKAHLFIVPNDENYDEAIKIKKEKNYDIDIIGVSTFEEVLKYLEN